jgi:crotonobetainyl-CoA:carnitine CoA-transferase CaiB-like acyl-CoA transferase
MYGGALARAFTIPLTAWMVEEGMAPDWLKNMNWAAFDYSRAKPEEVDRIAAEVAKFFAKHTKAELWEGGIKRRCVVYPVASPRETVQNVQLSARDYWSRVEHPELKDTLTYLGPWARPSATPLNRPRRPPRIGEHNSEVFAEVGLAPTDMVALAQAGVL